MTHKILNRTLTIFIFTIFNISCSKSNSPTLPPSIVGKWKWISTTNIYPLSVTNPATPANTGIQEILTFNADATWKDM